MPTQVMKMFRKNANAFCPTSRGCLHVLGIVILTAHFSALAVPVVTIDHNTTGYTVSGTDLLQGSVTLVDDTALLINVGESWGGNTVSNLTDGQFPPGGGNGLAIASGVLIYQLNTTANTNGYNISGIKTYGGWPNWGRSRQEYDIAYTTVDDPNTFVDLVTGVDSAYYLNDAPSYTSVSIADDVNPWLAKRVSAVRFTFPNQLNGGAGYRELDVLGQPDTGTQVVKPLIVVQPRGAAVPVGSNVVFSVGASGTEPLYYQWYKNGTAPLAGKTDPTLALNAVSLGDAGVYSVVVSNSVGTATSDGAVLAVANADMTHGSTPHTVSSADLLQSPGIAVNASQLSINAGESGSFGIPSLTDGVFPTDGNALAIASGVLTYTLNTTVHTQGYIVTNISTYGGWANWGRSEQLYTVSYSTVANPTNFIDIVSVGSSYYFDDVPSYTAFNIYNANSGVLATGVKAIRFTFPTQLNGGAGYRELDVLGSPIIDTTPAKPQIVLEPQDTFAPAGSTVTLTVLASGYPLPVYQWVKNGTTVLTGKTNASLLFESVSAADVGLYSVTISNSQGGVVSRQAALKVIDLVTERGTEEYLVSSNDLLQTYVSAIDSSTIIRSAESGSYQVGSLADGIFNTDTNDNRAYSVSGGDLIYYLGGPSDFKGFSISNINVYGGWPNPGRDAQNYVVSYSTVSAPSNFIDIATVSFNPPGSAPSYTAVRISNGGGGILCNEVRAIRIHFTAQENAAAGYREIDVLGAPIPVPGIALIKKDSAGALLGLKGAAGQSYTVFRATDLPGSWDNLGSKAMGVDGTATFLDSNAPVGGAFYRLFGP